jgi:hypothetical protein
VIGPLQKNSFFTGGYTILIVQGDLHLLNMMESSGQFRDSCYHNRSLQFAA